MFIKLLFKRMIPNFKNEKIGFAKLGRIRLFKLSQPLP
jgi:hypothetical protein